MSRKIRIKRKFPSPDVKYKSLLLSFLINRILKNGKTRLARTIVYQALTLIEKKSTGKPLAIFEKAVRNISPKVKLKPRRSRGSTYQVPSLLSRYHSVSIGLRWLTLFANKRSGKGMALKLASEIMDASKFTGNTYKKKEEIHKMALANKAFLKYSKKKTFLKKKRTNFPTKPLPSLGVGKPLPSFGLQKSEQKKN